MSRHQVSFNLDHSIEFLIRAAPEQRRIILELSLSSQNVRIREFLLDITLHVEYWGRWCRNVTLHCIYILAILCI